MNSKRCPTGKTDAGTLRSKRWSSRPTGYMEPDVRIALWPEPSHGSQRGRIDTRNLYPVSSAYSSPCKTGGVHRYACFAPMTRSKDFVSLPRQGRRSTRAPFGPYLRTIASPLRGDFAFYTPAAYSYTDVHIHRIVRIRTGLSLWDPHEFTLNLSHRSSVSVGFHGGY